MTFFINKVPVQNRINMLLYLDSSCYNPCCYYFRSFAWSFLCTSAVHFSYYTDWSILTCTQTIVVTWSLEYTFHLLTVLLSQLIWTRRWQKFNLLFNLWSLLSMAWDMKLGWNFLWHSDAILISAKNLKEEARIIMLWHNSLGKHYQYLLDKIGW